MSIKFQHLFQGADDLATIKLMGAKLTGKGSKFPSLASSKQPIEFFNTSGKVYLAKDGLCTKKAFTGEYYFEAEGTFSISKSTLNIINA